MTLSYSTSTSSNPTNLLALNRTFDSSRKILNALNVLVLKPGILANNRELRAMTRIASATVTKNFTFRHAHDAKASLCPQ